MGRCRCHRPIGVCPTDAPPLLLEISCQGFSIHLLRWAGNNDKINRRQVVDRRSEGLADKAFHQVPVDTATDLFLANHDTQTRMPQPIRARQNR